MSERYRRGVEIAQQLAPEAVDKFFSSAVAEVAPDFARMAIEFSFGDLYARSELDLPTREVVAIAALASLGHARQLRQHVAAALELGIDRRTIVEILMQCAVYTGFPNALDALGDCHDLLSDDDCLAGACR